MLPAGVAARWCDETEFLQSGDQPLTASQLEVRLDIHMILLGAAGEPSGALACFHALATLRLDACIERLLPGMYRRIERFRKDSKQP